MWSAIIPQRLDNAYRGQLAALWIFGAILLLKTGVALGTIFNGRAAAQSADGVPLQTFGAAGADAVITLFALWGLSQLIVSVIGALALVRYRAMVPLMFVLLLAYQIASRFVLSGRPIVAAGPHPGTYVNLALLVALIVGVVLSALPRANLPNRSTV
jgi:hypothetical protein